jgi:O-antigen ligase
MFSEAPIFGQGFGSFVLFSFGPYPHNIFAEIGSTGGLVGIALLLLWLATVGLAVARVYRLQPAYGALLAAIGIVSFSQMQVSFAFFMGRPLFLVCAIGSALSSVQAARARALHNVRARGPVMRTGTKPISGLSK